MRNEIGHHVFSIKATVLTLLVVASLSLVILFIYFPKYKDAIIFTVSLVAAGAAFYVAYLTLSAHKVNLQRDKMRVALDLISFLESDDLKKSRYKIHAFFKEKTNLSDDEVYNAIIQDEDLDKAANNMLNALEFTAINVLNGYADELMLYNSYTVLFERTSTILEPYIVRLRDVYRRQAHGSKVYCDLEYVSQCWRRNKSAVTGRHLLISVTPPPHN